MNNETELKLLLAPQDHSRILIAPCLAGYPRSTLHLVNTYFDTPERVLNSARVALRIREKNGRYIQTLKTKGESVCGLSHRGEWEWNLPSPALDIERLSVVLPEVLSGVDLTTLQPVFRTDFKRQVIDIVWQGAEIELALDLGEVIAGERTLPISELELELKSGDESSLYSLADALRQDVKLTSGDISKAEQGYRLAQGDYVT